MLSQINDVSGYNHFYSFQVQDPIPFDLLRVRKEHGSHFSLYSFYNLLSGRTYEKRHPNTHR